MPTLIGMSTATDKDGSLVRSQTSCGLVEQLRNELTEFINERIVKVPLDLSFKLRDGIIRVSVQGF